MGDMKDKFKGFMKKVNNQLTPATSGKFKGQGRVLGSSSSSGPTNSNPNRPTSGSQFVNPNRNLNSSSVNSKPLSQNQKTPISEPKPSSFEGEKGSISSSNSIPNPKSNPDLDQSRPSKDGFDPFDSLITSGNRNKNGYSLNVFECPVCGSGFNSEEDVSLHIESCIDNSSNNAGNGAGAGADVNGAGLDTGSVEIDGSTENQAESNNKLEACVGVYLSGNPSDGSVDVVLRLLRNIVKEPENPKFRKVRMSNPKIREAIGEVTGCIELLEVVGFELKEDEGEMWAVMDSPSEECIMVLKDSVQLLERAKGAGSMPSASSIKVDEKTELEKDNKESEPKNIDRQIKVFFSVSENAAARIELPDSFFRLSVEEVRKEAEMRKKKLADSQLLIPKSYKEKQAQAARRRYTRSIIRVQFPDGVVLQGVFSPREPTTALYEFVSSALKQQGLEFELVHPLPVKRRVIPCFPAAGQRASRLEEEDLVPSALVKFKPFETDSMVFTGLKNELLEISEPLVSGKI